MTPKTKQLLGCIITLVTFIVMLMYGFLIAIFELGPLGIFFTAMLMTISYLGALSFFVKETDSK